MTYHKTTTPNTDPEPAPQYCGDDPFGLDDIPDFLRRTPSKTKPVQQPHGGDKGGWLWPSF